MKQTIEEAASEYMNIPPVKAAIKCGDIEDLESHIKVAFKSGAEWQAKQSPWISVKERLPEENKGAFFIVEWKDHHKGYFVGIYEGNDCWESDHRIFLPNSPNGKVTHWMPIPEFNV